MIERRSYSSQGMRNKVEYSLQGSSVEAVENPYIRESVPEKQANNQRVTNSTYEQQSKAQSSGTQVASRAQEFALRETEINGHIVQTSEISPRTRMTNTNSNHIRENTYFNFGAATNKG